MASAPIIGKARRSREAILLYRWDRAYSTRSLARCLIVLACAFARFLLSHGVDRIGHDFESLIGDTLTADV
jgi:hypothetical protein